jgi:hypothetical protein
VALLMHEYPISPVTHSLGFATLHTFLFPGLISHSFIPVPPESLPATRLSTSVLSSHSSTYQQSISFLITSAS